MLSKIISPTIALTLLRTQIEKQVEKKVDRYSIFYHMGDDVLKFKIFPKDEPKKPIKARFDNDTLGNAIETMIKAKVKDTGGMEAYLINYSKESQSVVVFSKDKKGIKKREKFEL